MKHSDVGVPAHPTIFESFPLHPLLGQVADILFLPLVMAMILWLSGTTVFLQRMQYAVCSMPILSMT
jgi:hypothetical protein